MDLKKHIRSIKDYPKKGILFRDITTLIKNPEAFKYTNDRIIEIAKKIDFDKVSAIESRGFIFAAAVSQALNKPFILLRKKIAKISFVKKVSPFLDQLKESFVKLFKLKNKFLFLVYTIAKKVIKAYSASLQVQIVLLFQMMIG